MHISQSLLQCLKRPKAHYRCMIQTLNCSTDTGAVIQPNESTLKHFSEVPGPPRLPLVGNLHLFTKFGPYSFEKLYDAYADLHKQYGPVVRLDLGIQMILLFDPDDIMQMFNLGESYPERPVFEALKHYRLKERKDIYSSGGLLSENGPEWDRLRKAVSFMMVPNLAKSYFPAQEEVADDFVSRIQCTRDSNGMIPNFLDELYRYTEEAIGLVCFGERLGLLDPRSSDSEFSKKLTHASEETLQALVDTLLGFPWWKIFKTPTYKKLVRSQDFFQSFATSCMEKVKIKLEDPKYKDDANLEFFKKLFLNKNLKPSDINTIMTEIFSAGIDATGNAIGFLLYNLAKNPTVQEKLYQNIREHSINGIDESSWRKMQYLKLCIQESHRLTPTTGGNARILPTAAVFSGYEIPPKVLCIALHPIISRLEKYFENPLDFRPERWIKGDQSHLTSESHPYCVAPFSHGVRRCVGQRFAEQEIRLCIIKIIQKFRVEYDGPEVGIKVRLSLIPDKPLNFKFIER